MSKKAISIAVLGTTPNIHPWHAFAMDMGKKCKSLGILVGQIADQGKLEAYLGVTGKIYIDFVIPGNTSMIAAVKKVCRRIQHEIFGPHDCHPKE